METVLGDMSRQRVRAPLRVLVLMHELSLTGSPRLALEMCRAARPAIEVRTVAASGGPLEQAFRDVGPVDVLARLPRFGIPDADRAHLIAGRAIGRLVAPMVAARLRLWKPDVVLVNSVAALTLVPRLALDHARVAVYVHELATGLDRLTDRHRSLLRSVPSRYFAVSEVVADELALRGVSRAAVAIVPPAIDVQTLVALAGANATLPDLRKRPPFVVGGAGNPHWTKGVEAWLQVGKALLGELGHESVRFKWVGVRANEAGNQLRYMIKVLGLTDYVTLVPETQNPYPHFREFDVFAMTSWEESASLVVLESMALGVPVVCFRGSGGPAEQIGDAGIVIDDFAPGQMAFAIANLLRDGPQRSGLIARGRERVLADYGPERVAQKFVAELRDVAIGRVAKP